MRRIICVTGPMAAGKNAASDILARRGFACVDADSLVHQALARPEVQKQVLAAFGALAAGRGLSLTMPAPDGSGLQVLNRRALGALLFSDRSLLLRQEAILHPHVDALIDDFIQAHPGQDIVLNATVLYKTASMARCSCVLFVDAPLPLRFFRARRRDGMKARQILARFWEQRNLFAKYKNLNADIQRVSNTGNKKALERKIESFLQEA